MYVISEMETAMPTPQDKERKKNTATQQKSTMPWEFVVGASWRERTSPTGRETTHRKFRPVVFMTYKQWLLCVLRFRLCHQKAYIYINMKPTLAWFDFTVVFLSNFVCVFLFSFLWIFGCCFYFAPVCCCHPLNAAAAVVRGHQLVLSMLLPSTIRIITKHSTLTQPPPLTDESIFIDSQRLHEFI